MLVLAFSFAFGLHDCEVSLGIECLKVGRANGLINLVWLGLKLELGLRLRQELGLIGFLGCSGK